MFDPRDLNDYTFSAYRHARTFVGIDSRGRLLLATADGIPGVSAGLTLTEEADVMRSLGAVDAMNLDGGGSTQFACEDQLVNDASSSPLRPGGGHDPSRAVAFGPRLVVSHPGCPGLLSSRDPRRKLWA